MVASSLQTNSSSRKPRAGELAGQDRLDRRVADALDVVVAGRSAAARRSARRPAACRARGAGSCRGCGRRGPRPSADARTNTAAATPMTAPSTTYSSSDRARCSARSAARRGWPARRRPAASPKNSRPMKVAVPVASATGRKVLTLTSGIISSIANSTPPIGVLKVAAMPAPAPAATRVMRWPAGMRDRSGRASSRAPSRSG